MPSHPGAANALAPWPERTPDLMVRGYFTFFVERSIWQFVMMRFSLQMFTFLLACLVPCRLLLKINMLNYLIVTPYQLNTPITVLYPTIITP